MKAVICPNYGPPEVLQLKEVNKPVPKEDEVLIKIHASAVTNSDIFIRGSKLPIQVWIPMRLSIGILRPRKSTIGLVLAGEIEKTGKNIKRFKPGDKVYGMSGFTLSAYAEYICLKETDSIHGCISKMPTNISYEEATVANYGGLLAMQNLELGNIEKAKRVLVYGASGTTGTMAIQIAKHFGANVTGICSTTNLELVKSLGADEVIDYTKQDFIPTELTYDLILDAVGKAKTSTLKKACKKALNPNGKFVSIDDGALKLDSTRLDRISKIIEKGNIKFVIDKVYPLEQIVEAHKYVETGHKKGGVVIKIM